MTSHRGLLAALLLAVTLSCTSLPRTPSDISLRAMTYNIQAGGTDLERTAQTIRNENPDVVGLQEVDVHWGTRSHFADQATLLGQRLGMHVRFAGIYKLPGADASAPPREYGVALLSRFPIVEFHNRILTRLPTQPEGAPATPMPGFLDATLDVRGTRVRVFNTHLDYRADPKVRQQQVRETLALMSDADMPTMLFGDLNAGPDAPELQPLLARLQDSWRINTDSGLTYPAIKPVKRIDYVLTSQHFRTRSARVPVTQASDHRPVIVELVLSTRPTRGGSQ